MNRNATLLGLLAFVGVVAGALLIRQHFFTPARVQAATVSGTSSVAAAAAPAPNPAETNPPVAQRIVSAEVQREWPRWLDRPVRDPFQILRPVRPKSAAAETPVSRFKLLAVWLQSGGRFAVIDRAVYGEGDQLAEYRIVRINADEVVVRGAERTERITFTSHVPAPKVPSGRGTNLIEQWLGPEKEDLF